MTDKDYSSFKEKLDSTHQWPSLYMFKFIVGKGQEEEVKKLFPKNDLKIKPSSSGNYLSVTAKVMMASSDHVIDIYEKAHKIEGLIAL